MNSKTSTWYRVSTQQMLTSFSLSIAIVILLKFYFMTCASMFIINMGLYFLFLYFSGADIIAILAMQN